MAKATAECPLPVPWFACVVHHPQAKARSCAVQKVTPVANISLRTEVASNYQSSPMPLSLIKCKIQFRHGVFEIGPRITSVRNITGNYPQADLIEY